MHMIGKRLAKSAWAWVLGFVLLGSVLGIAPEAEAAKVSLPGERTAEFHGFYELRLEFLGADAPFNGNGLTFSQFRHVLDVEADIDIFPEGIGPFDMVVAFTRFLVTYECIYDRACDIFNSADNYGSNPGGRTPNRLPRNLIEADSQDIAPPFAAGLFPLKYRPGSLVPAVEQLNSSGRFRNCINDPGVAQNPSVILGIFCNIHDRSPNDGPIDEFADLTRDFNRAGHFNRRFKFQLLNGARASIGEERFTELSGLLNDTSTSLDARQTGRYRGLLGAAAVETDATKKAALEAEAATLIAGTFDAAIPELIETRPDPSIFQTIAAERQPTFLTALWGATQLADFTVPYLASIDTRIVPIDPFGGAPLDIIDENSAGLTDTLAKVSDDVPPGIDPVDFGRGRVPFFVGGDGIRNTSDDLPFQVPSLIASAELKLLAPASETFMETGAATGLPFFTTVVNHVVDGADVEFFGVADPMVATEEGCEVLFPGAGNDLSDGKCIHPDSKLDVSREAFERGCGTVTSTFRAVGINADDDCIMMNILSGGPGTGSIGEAETPVALINSLSDRRLRPAGVEMEPIDATDFKLYAERGGKVLPARPRNATNSLFFNSPGLDRTLRKYHHVVSALDLDKSTDELQWGHGANEEDEREFKEGFIEFEMFDSQLYGKTGKITQIWGKTELFRNQDRVNPLDLGNGVITNLEEARIGQWGLDLVLSPEKWMRVGPWEDLRLEFLVIFDDFQPVDLGKCGENSALALVCLKSFGAMANGLVGLGLAGEINPSEQYGGFKAWDYGVRVEGRWDRVTFAVTNFWGWDDFPILELVNQYERRVDPITGAPVNAQGPLVCQYRSADGSPTGDVASSVGPNGIAGDSDDILPSVGNCLLMDNVSGSSRQAPRAPSVVALNHFANQTLFHTICTITFDPDRGFCLLDQLNHPAFQAFVADILVGDFLTGKLAISGSDSIRTTADPFTNINLETVFTSVGALDWDSLSTPQKAMFGCGPAFHTPCDRQDGGRFDSDDGAILDSLDRTVGQLSGGVDLLNADGEFVMADNSIVKFTSPGHLVSLRNNPDGTQRFEAGVTHGGYTPQMMLDGGIELRNAILKAQQEGTSMGIGEDDEMPVGPTDHFVEPMPWMADPNWLDEGVILYQVANPTELDPRCHQYPADDPRSDFFDPTGNFSLCFDGQGNPKTVLNKVDDPNNPLNVLREDMVKGLGEYGEYCGNAYGGDIKFNAGCTDPEFISANFERFLIIREIVGADQVFEPPETVIELNAMLADDFSLVRGGDPISGPDGIFSYNLHTGFGEDVNPLRYSAGENDVIAVRVEAAVKVVDVDDIVNYDPASCPDATCFARVGTAANGDDLVNAIPLVVTLGGFGSKKINFMKLCYKDAETCARLLAGDPVLIDGLPLRLDTLIDREVGQDLDKDGQLDLDLDKDGVVDFLDDFSAGGHISDDNILCGSGLPGDVLQEAVQFQGYNDEQRSLFATRFPDGLPPRSPTFCSDLVGLLSATGFTLPTKRAGGDGTYGRRDFIWHGGRQVALSYQKNNVLGFALDFAEDRTKTSWGIEFTWTADKLFNDTLEFSGLHESDDFVMSVSVDRPTFFNFLNPNRTFFLNFQFFVRYLSDFNGSSSGKDGMFGVANGEFSGLGVFTFFTGYFQDRLMPRASFVLDPTNNNGAVLGQLLYRWNESFSTTLKVNHFFGHTVQGQERTFPIALLRTPDQTSESSTLTRLFNPVRNRDSLLMIIRWTY